MKNNDCMFFKIITRMLKNKKFQWEVNIDRRLLDYVHPNETIPNKNKGKWYNNFVGFYPLMKSPDDLDFGYWDDGKPSTIHYPIFVGIVPEELEDDKKQHPDIDIEVFKYVVMFYGSDNTSYFLRFNSIRDVHRFLNKNINRFNDIGSIREFYSNNMYWYNS